jgi:hypothetical protein
MIARAPSGHRCGQSHQRAKLTDQQVMEMRQIHESGKAGYRKLAAMFGCGESTARDILTYRTRYSA